MELLLLTLVLSCGFLLRLTFNTTTNTDEWVTIWLIRRHRKQNWINYLVDDSVVPGYFGYPVLPYFLISQLPERFWGIAGRILNSLFDILTAICIYIVSRWVLAELPIVKLAGFHLSLVSTLIFITSPALFPVTTRLHAIKARTMGLFFTTLYFITLFFTVSQFRISLFFIAVAVGLLCILTSQFAAQVALFFSVFLAIYLLSPIPLILTVTVILLGVVLPKLGTRGSIRFMWEHKRWYVRNHSKVTVIALRNDLHDLLRMPIYLFTDFRKFCNLYFQNNTFIIALYSAPLAFVLLFYWIAGWNDWRDVVSSPTYNYLWGITLASFALFVLTSLPQLKFLGQAERYLEYSAPAYAILAVAWLASFPEETSGYLVWFFVLLHLVVSQINLVFLQRESFGQSKIAISSGQTEVVDWCMNNLSSASFATVPIKMGHVFSIFLNDAVGSNYKFYYRWIQRPGETAFRHFEEDTGGLSKARDGWAESFEIFRVSPDDLNKKYGITHLIVSKNEREGLRLSWSPEDAKLLDHPLFANREYAIYEVSNLQTSQSKHQQ